MILYKGDPNNFNSRAEELSYIQTYNNFLPASGTVGCKMSRKRCPFLCQVLIYVVQHVLTKFCPDRFVKQNFDDRPTVFVLFIMLGLSCEFLSSLRVMY